MFKNLNKQGAIDMIFIAALVIVLAVGGLVYWRISNADEIQPVEATFVDGLGEEQTITSFEECMEWVMPWEELEDGRIKCTAPGDVVFYSENELEENDNNIPANTATYTNEDIGVSFNYPKEYGEVVASEFDEDDTYLFFTFTNKEDYRIGAPKPGYTTEGRGGAMTDYTDYTVKSDGIYLQTLNNNDSQFSIEGYKELDGDKIVSYNRNYFGDEYYHVFIKTEGSTTGFNVAVSSSEVDKSDFMIIVDSIRSL